LGPVISKSAVVPHFIKGVGIIEGVDIIEGVGIIEGVSVVRKAVPRHLHCLEAAEDTVGDGSGQLMESLRAEGMRVEPDGYLRTTWLV